MAFERIAVVTFSIVVTSAVATGQQRTEPPGQPSQGPAQTVVEREYASGLAPWRRIETHSQTDGRDVVVETFEAPDLEGRWSPVQETVTEVVRTADNVVEATRNVFGFGADGRPRLLEVTESLWETFLNGDTSAVHDTWLPDLDRRLALTSRLIEQTLSTAPDVHETDMTLLVRDINGTLRESERTEHTARVIEPGVERHESIRLVRDLNGRWKPAETRRADVREIGASDRVEEETIEGRDLNGNRAVRIRNVIHRARASDRDEVVIETYAPYADGLRRSETRLALSQRVRLTTTATPEGGSHTVEEVEGRSRVALGDAMHVIRRTVTTVREASPDRWITERQVSERDANDRLRPVITDTEERTSRTP